MAEHARTILIIDDEPQIRRAVTGALGALSNHVLAAATGREGLDLAATEQPELIILDLGLPDMYGGDVCEEIRRWSTAPIIVLSARHAQEEKVKLLSLGADDYITKPFSMREFEARVRVQLRRVAAGGEASGPPPITAPGVSIDFSSHRATRNGTIVRLTRVEWRLLQTLAAQAGRTMTHRQIFDEVWGRTFGNPQQHLRVHVTHLRRKIEPDPVRPTMIVTEPGVGYRLELPPSAS